MPNVQCSDSGLDEGRDPPSRTFSERAFAQRVGQSLEVRDAVNHHGWKIRIGGPKMEHRMTKQPHAERLVQVEVIYTKQLDARPDLREQAALDLNSLRRQNVGHRRTLRPVDEIRDADRDDDDEPLADRVDHGWVTDEELPLDLGLLCALVRDQIGVAEPAFNRRGLDGLATHRAQFRVVGHTPSIGRMLAEEVEK